MEYVKRNLFDSTGKRQAGIIAATGIVALEKMVDRLADDHANAKYLAQRLNDIPGLSVDIDGVETNMVYVDHASSTLSTEQLVALLRSAGVVVSARPSRYFRLVPNRHHTRAILEEAVRRIESASLLHGQPLAGCLPAANAANVNPGWKS